ncbi:MAG: ABC transporter [Gammaproteobacteria bacterium]|nr:ABC transporter [Gammaproteobacteria bacterium]|tara:strand:- start:177 stop:824 length:648 start_codon:yes stop_codon:yes gene_type:complete
MTSVLKIEQLSYSYTGSNRVLDNLELEIQAGERIGLLGPSGCGKSTLLRLIAGLEKPDGGSITILGNLVSGHRAMVSPENRKIGLVVQEKALFPHMSVRDNIAFGIRKEKRKKTVVANLLEMLKITSLAEKFPHEISGGEQQRVALARSIAPAPKLLMLDEPFSALDQSLKNELYSEISKVLIEKQITILLVTHDRNEAKILTDRQLEIADLQKK